MSGGAVTVSQLHLHNNNNANRETFTITGGVLNVTKADAQASDSGSGTRAVVLGHWGGGGSSSLNVLGGTVNVNSGYIRIGWDSATALNIGSAADDDDAAAASTAVVNAKGIEYSQKNNNAALTINSGRLNIGSYGFVNYGNTNENRKVELLGGTLGVLDASGWTLDASSLTTTVGTITIDTTVVGTETGANISLLGALTAAEGGMAVTLAGNGSLTIDHALAGSVTLAEGSKAKLTLSNLDNFEKKGEATYSGYGESTVSGYMTQMVKVCKDGVSAPDTVWVGDASYAVDEDGWAEVTGTAFMVGEEINYSDTLADVQVFDISAAGKLTFADASLLNKLGAIAEGGVAVLTAADGSTELLKITGNCGVAEIGEVTVEGNVISINGTDRTFGGNIEVLSGTTLKQLGRDSLGNSYYNDGTRVIKVQNGATLDINGNEAYYHVVLEEGATLANSGGGSFGRNLPYIELQGDATFNAVGEIVMNLGAAGVGTDTKLDLKGKTLTKTGAGKLSIITAVTAGTIDAKEGFVSFGSSNVSGVDLRLQKDSRLEIAATSVSFNSLTIYDSESEAAFEMHVNSGKTATVTGAYTSEVAVTKKGGGNLTLAGTASIAKDLTIEVGSVTLAGETDWSAGSLTVGSGATLAQSSTLKGGAGTTASLQGTVNVLNIADMEVETTEGALKNGFQDMVFVILSADTVTKGDAFTFQLNGQAQESGWAVADNKLTYTKGQDTTYWVTTGTVNYGAEGQTGATAYQVLSGGALAIADSTETVLPIVNNGTVLLQGGTSDLAAITNDGDGVVYMTNADGAELLSFTGSFSGKSYNAVIDATDSTVVTSTAVSGEGVSAFNGTLTVLSGATFKGMANFGGANIHVAGTYDLNGGLVPKNFTLLEGGVLANTGNGLQDMGQRQIDSLTLEGDASVNAASNITMIGSGYATVRVNIGSNTLTKTGAGVFQINNGNITGDGTIAVQEGELRLFSHSKPGNVGTAADATFDVKGGATLRVDVNTSIGRITTTAADADSNLAFGNGVTLVLGSAEKATSSIDKVSINAAQSATLDLAAGTTLQGLTKVEGGTLNIAGSGTYKQTTELTGNLQLAEGWAGKIAVGEGGTLNLGALGGTTSVTVEEGGALGVSGDISCEISNTGALTATSISGKLSSTGGSLELSGDNAITSTDVTISGTELKGTWGASGLELGSGVSVGEGATITLDGATLTDTVANGGTLKLTGTTTLTVEGTELEATYSAGQNGYKTTGSEYAVLSSGALAEGSSNQWSVGGETVKKELDAAGKLVVSKTDNTTYWVREGTVDASSITDAATTTVALNGGTLSIDEDCDKDITVSAESSIIIVENETLSKSQLSGEGSASLSGEGTYDLGSDLTLGANATLADAWAGKVTSSATKVSTDTALSLGGKVELTAETLTLEADLTQAGELSLTATKELVFSTFDACLSADTLVLGGDLRISIGESTLEGATAIETKLIDAGTASSDKKLYTYVDDVYTEINAAGVAILEGIGKDGLYDAKLAWDGKALTLSTAVKEDVLVWNESTDFGDTTTEWNADLYTADKDVAFVGGCAGEGSGEVKVTGGTAEVKNIIIANHDEDAAQSYTFKGESIEAAGDLSVGDGASLTVSNDMTVGGVVTVSDSSALVVNGGSLEVTTGNVNASEGTVNVTAGTLTVGGALDAVSITNAGTLEVKGAEGAVAGEVENTGTLTVTKDLSVATLDNRNELNAANVAATSITNSGALNVTGVVTAASTSTFGLRSMPVGGEIVNTGYMTVGGVDAAKFTMTKGTLEITSAAGFKSASTEITGGTLKADTVNWGIDGGSIGGVTIEGDMTITLSNVKLTAALTNNDNLSLGGTIDVTGLTGVDKSVYTDLDGSMSADGNGYTAQTTLYTIATGSGTTTAEGVTWNTGDATAEYEFNAGLLTEKKEYTMETYHVNKDMAYSYSIADEMTTNGTTAIVVKGGTLSVNSTMSSQQLMLDGGKANLNAAVEKGIVANSGSINLGSSATGAVSVSGREVNITGGNSNVELLLSKVTANLDVKESLVTVAGSEVTLNGTLTDGILMVNQAIGAQGDLQLQNSALNVIMAGDAAVMDEKTVAAILKDGVVDLGNLGGDARVEVGTYSEQTGFKSSEGFTKYFTNVRLEEGKVVADRNTTYYSGIAGESVSGNGAVGIALADAALAELNPQATAPAGGLAAVLTALDKAGTSEEADELGASLAGASTAVLGMATMGDVDRQLQAIRNRTTTMGVDQSVANEDMPYFNAWINAEGDRSELSESGTEGGYELSSWGGTVGFDVDLCPTFTAGMALTAMYGDIDTTGADKASGNIDTYYVTAFARYAPSAWTHTFVATVGMSDISLDRHVAGAEMEGETDGLSFGLMYEVGRVFALTEDGSTCLQPVFNVTWKHTAIDAYTEDGSDLALEVDEQTLDTVTFGLGARLQTVVGESMYNRTSILEARVLAKADVGDRSGSADVAISALPGAKASVDSAEMGAFGLEAGAGLTIPVGDEGGSIFMDASVELRSDYTNVNGTVGYRINF